MNMLLLIYLCIPGIFADTIHWHDNGYHMTIVDGVLTSVKNIENRSDSLVIANNFTAIHWKAFNDVGNIEVLIVDSHNTLVILPPLVFLPLKKLIFLYLANNMKILSTINAFVGLNKLIVLDATGVLHEGSIKSNFNGLTKPTRVINGFEHLVMSLARYTQPDQRPTTLLCMNEKGILKSLQPINDLDTLRISVKECYKADLLDNYKFTTGICDLSGKGITGFERHWYKINYNPMMLLDLQDNHITHISPAMMNDLPLQVYGVSLSRNKLTVLQSEMINNKHLRHLFLDNNFIKKIEDNALKSTELKKLVLSHNYLSSNEFMKTLPHTIRELYVDNNYITTLFPNAFARFEQIQYVDFSANKLENLPENAFKGLERVLSLKLHRNILRNLTRDSLRHLPCDLVESLYGILKDPENKR